MPDVSMFTPRTERGSRGKVRILKDANNPKAGFSLVDIKGGISNIFNRSLSKEHRKAQESRRLQNRTNRGNWSNESRGKATEVPFPKPVGA